MDKTGNDKATYIKIKCLSGDKINRQLDMEMENMDLSNQ